MTQSIIKYIGSQPLMKVIRSLLLSSKPRHLRDLASSHNLSPAGVSDIIQRLDKLGVLSEVRKGNRRAFNLKLTEIERECLKKFFGVFQNCILEERAIMLSRNAAKKLKWMDEAHKFYRGVKGKQGGSTSSS